MPGIHPAVVESMLFLHPACCQSLDPIWSTQTTLFCMGFLGLRVGSKTPLWSPCCWRRGSCEGSWSCLCWCFLEGRNQNWFFWAFLGLVFATAQQEGFQCPGRVRVWAQTGTGVASISWGCQDTQQQRAAVAKGGRLDGAVWAWP